jgi:hypothetical protein
MRIIYSLLVVLILASCSKKDAVVSGNLNPSVNATQEINATINADFTYEFPLKSPDVKIHQQALHFSLSEIGMDAKNGNPVYQYLPSKGFTGTDEVTLKEIQTYTSFSSEGCNNMGSPQTVTKTSFIKIRFTVN